MNIFIEEEETVLVTKPDYAPKFSAPNGMITVKKIFYRM